MYLEVPLHRVRQCAHGVIGRVGRTDDEVYVCHVVRQAADERDYRLDRHGIRILIICGPSAPSYTGPLKDPFIGQTFELCIVIVVNKR